MVHAVVLAGWRKLVLLGKDGQRFEYVGEPSKPDDGTTNYKVQLRLTAHGCGAHVSLVCLAKIAPSYLGKLTFYVAVRAGPEPKQHAKYLKPSFSTFGEDGGVDTKKTARYMVDFSLEDKSPFSVRAFVNSETR